MLREPHIEETKVLNQEELYQGLLRRGDEITQIIMKENILDICSINIK